MVKGNIVETQCSVQYVVCGWGVCCNFWAVAVGDLLRMFCLRRPLSADRMLACYNYCISCIQCLNGNVIESTLFITQACRVCHRMLKDTLCVVTQTGNSIMLMWISLDPTVGVWTSTVSYSNHNWCHNQYSKPRPIYTNIWFGPPLLQKWVAMGQQTREDLYRECWTLHNSELQRNMFDTVYWLRLHVQCV